MRLPLLAFALATSLLLGTGACATYQEDLNRAQRLYHENEYERALALFRVLEEDTDSLSLNDQARYAYLRGMTDYRLGFRPDARHWLAIAKATEQEHPGGLSPDWKQRMEEALTDLNRDVFGGAEVGSGSASTGTERPLQADAAPAPAPPAAGTCQSSTECPSGQACQGGLCVRL
jgi:hypothetical protein